MKKDTALVNLARYYIAMVLCSASVHAYCQDYHAIQGSNHAGALGVHNNPASIVNTPYPWDLTLAGIQAKYQTNAVKVIDYSLVTSVLNSKFMVLNGQFKRFGDEQANLNLLNGRIALGRRRAIAFGANLRSASNVRTEEYNYIDSIDNINQFLALNTQTGPFDARFRSSSLFELYLAYAQTVWENTNYRLNGGLTVKINRGVSGVRAEVNNIRHRTTVVNDQTEYVLNGGSFAYAYSSNFDKWDNSRDNNSNLKEFLKATRTAFSFDAGLELLIRPEDVPGFMADEEAYYDYDWKISASLIDFGWGQYRGGVESRKGSIPASGITGSELDAAIDSTVKNLPQFNDSLGGLLHLEGLANNFKIISPARLVLNVDRYLAGAWFVNAELSINISPWAGDKRLYVRNMNLLRLTPRWETRKLGVYMPIQVSNQGKFWIGAGFKAGPLLLGFHNLGNIFSKNKMANGGGYIALTLRPMNKVTASTRGNSLDCPPL
ncbi:hypothetical protein [Flavihumibacter solisilvae]|uniref:Uncharacterized protein n=1 Tax=Flavihumibacter solisilvae TaxID=1349421 RepID=A0A0C1KZU3_9BACT|nr:hypothetical protein [Flavihumibacter solisilvae]KIC92816.1 hypothetical protein OI18_20545 [Flavihumibacter solisilvae]